MKNRLFLFVAAGLLFFWPGGSLAQAQNYGLDSAGREAELIEPSVQEGGLQTIMGTAIGSLLSIVGILFFMLMLYGGFLWMTARGNEDQTEKAFKAIKAAVIGIAIVLASYALTNFVLNSVRRESQPVTVTQ